MDYYSVIKKNKILLFATTRMDLECIKLSEISQTDKDKYLYRITYMWSPKNKNSDYNKKETDS